MLLNSTLEHQEGVGLRPPSASAFGFWGTHTRLAAFWQAPTIGSFSLFKPTFLVYAGFSLATFFLARGKTMAQLAGLTAALTAGVQLWKTHAGGQLRGVVPAVLDSRSTVQRLRQPHESIGSACRATYPAARAGNSIVSLESSE